jgi:F-type H+-transporting ATPase subunit epsilon
MSGVMTAEVVSPERVLFSGEAVMVVTRTLGSGEIAFQPGHAPFVGALTENHTRIHHEDGSITHVAVHGGFVEVIDNRVAILSDLAELRSEIDVERARRAMERAEQALRHEHDLQTEAALRRAVARIRTAGDTVI